DPRRGAARGQTEISCEAHVVRYATESNSTARLSAARRGRGIRARQADKFGISHRDRNIACRRYGHVRRRDSIRRWVWQLELDACGIDRQFTMGAQYQFDFAGRWLQKGHPHRLISLDSQSINIESAARGDVVQFPARQ